ncbi:uncharacterized protein LOC134209375 [Armigeres subalbatus]|uniref:uncharacterized protein LOC134209375 n=1 Tax=Armigeres subalbatus TaxID=124917 RepID=UPI002ED00A8C
MSADLKPKALSSTTLKEAPIPLTAVVLFPPVICSRPGPVCELEDGVFRNQPAGKYHSTASNALSQSTFVSISKFRRVSASTGSNRGSSPKDGLADAPNRSPSQTPSSSSVIRTPGRALITSFMEDSNPFDSVVPIPSTIVAAENAAASDSRYLSVYYQNVRGVRTKTTVLKLRLSSFDYDVVVLSETWLKSDICNSELSSDYSIFRCDRSEFTSGLSRGGGVLVAVKRELQCTEVSLSDCCALEQVKVTLKLPHSSVHIFGIYLRPNSDYELYATHYTVVQSVIDKSFVYDVFLLLGDYNLPHLQWIFDDDINGYLATNASSEQEISLSEAISTCGLVQINPFVNRNNRLLDLIFTNASDNMDISQPVLPLIPIDEHHPPVVLHIDTCCLIPRYSDQEPDPMDYDFRQCDFTSLNTFCFLLSAVDWSHHFHGHSVDANVLLFYDKLYEILNLIAPRRRRINRGVNNKPWWNAQLRNLCNRLRRLRKQYIANKTNGNKVSLHQVETSYNDLLDASYRRYMNDLQSNLKNNPSRFWRFIKSQKTANQVPNNVVYGDTTATTSDEAANLFADFFQSVFNVNSQQTHPGSFFECSTARY